MKADELMIGDIVEFATKLYIVLGISHSIDRDTANDMWTIKLTDKKQSFKKVDTSLIGEVPINGDLLKKNEFKFENGWYVNMIKGVTNIYARNFTEATGVKDGAFDLWQFAFETNPVAYNDYWTFTYMHEIQHYYKLLGIKKSFKI